MVPQVVSRGGPDRAQLVRAADRETADAAGGEQRGEIVHPNVGNVAGAIFSAIEGLHLVPDQYLTVSRQAMADELIELFMRGMAPTRGQELLKCQSPRAMGI